MYVRALRYNKPAAELMLDIFNYTNGSRVEPWQVTFGEPVKVPEDPSPITPVHMNNYNMVRPTDGTLTTIEVVPTPESGWVGNLKLTYRREVLQDKFVNVPFVIYATDYTTPVILEELNKQYALFLDPKLVDVEIQQIDLNDVIFDTHMGSILDGDADSDYVPPIAYDAIIKMKDNHPVYLGEIRVYIREAVHFLNRNVKTTLEVRKYLGPEDHAKMPAEMILPNNRFVDHDHFMKNLKVGDLVEEWIVNTAKSITADDWVFTQNANPFNLYGARVVYNGLNTGEVYIDDPKVSNVLIIQFSDLHCTNIAGQWIIGYYNHDTWLRRVRSDSLPIQDQ
ncbi:hypothetical protein D3C85_16220 [compost metagenome]